MEGAISEQYLERGMSSGVWSESRVISVLYILPLRALRLISVDRERKGETTAVEAVNVLRGKIDLIKRKWEETQGDRRV
jgi:hypothetical protein